MKNQTTLNIELNNQILFNRPNSLFIGNITEVREKAIKVDYAMEPIFAGSGAMNVTIFNYSCWMPKSVIVDDKGILTVKKWFSNAFKGGHHIKKYFIEQGEKVFL